MIVSRKALRYTHLAATTLIGAFVYSESLRAFPVLEVLVQAVAFPLAALAGLFM